MSEIPADLRYTESHEWVAVDEDGNLRIGITDHAQSKLGDLVFVDLPEPGATFSAGDACAVVESVKAASDIYAPVDGEVISINEDLADSPELVNNDPYNDGWLYTMSCADTDALDALMTAEQYSEKLEDD
ncbi:MAG: glycine cleavage system protein GcvH [Wenzhouxiangellaceae bacterium]